MRTFILETRSKRWRPDLLHLLLAVHPSVVVGDLLGIINVEGEGRLVGLDRPGLHLLLPHPAGSFREKISKDAVGDHRRQPATAAHFVNLTE